jgi:sugar/nucleoside kinase (ribokinase family)
MIISGRIMGVGSPIIDLLARVSDEFLVGIEGAKGGMVLVDDAAMAALLASIPGEKVMMPGGSAGNTTFTLARLGAPCAFLGKVGDDAHGRYYREVFASLGGDVSAFKEAADIPTACCLSMITPDSQRTMRTNLAAAMTLEPSEIRPEDFAGCGLVHIEGYLLFNRDLLLAVLRGAKAAGCQVSLDLASFEVVNAAKDILPELLSDYVDLVYANEDEAAAYTGGGDPETALDALAELCAVAAVKLGAQGALVRSGSDTVRIAPVAAEHVIDTTGAGDLWAAGFLHGYVNGKPFDVCGRFGSVLGAEVVQHIGAEIPRHKWPAILEALAV